MDKPKNIEEYEEWLKSKLKISIDPEIKNYYNQTAKNFKSKMEESEFWKDFTTSLNKFNQEFIVKTEGN